MTANALKSVVKGESDNPITSFSNYLERNKSKLAAALPKHISPDRMIRLALTEFQKVPLLQKCTPNSIFGAIMQASQLGLEIGVLGQCYLLPYYNTKASAYQAQIIPGYKGLISLARRSGEVNSIETNIVYENDEFELELGLDTKVVHKPNLMGDRGRPRLVYGVAHFKDGGHHFEWMTLTEVERIRSRSQSKDKGPWVTDYDQMVRKTVIRRMCNYLPMSIELANALQVSDAADDGKATTIEGDVVVVHDDGAPEGSDDDGGGSGGSNGSGGAATVAELKKEDPKPTPAPQTPTQAAAPKQGGLIEEPAAEEVLAHLLSAKSVEELDLAMDMGKTLPAEDRAILSERYRAQRKRLEA